MTFPWQVCSASSRVVLRPRKAPSPVPAHLRVPLLKLHDLAAWQGNGMFRATKFVAFGWDVQHAECDWATTTGEIKLSHIQGDLYQGTGAARPFSR